MASVPRGHWSGRLPTTALNILRKPGGKRLREQVIFFICLLCAAISIVTTIGIITVLAREAIRFFQTVSPAVFYTGREWAPQFEPPKFGVLPLICGTLLITVGSGVIAIPLGLLTAIYLSEYAKPKVRKFVKPALELLAGIPTVVYGYFAISFVTPLLQKLSPRFEVYNVAAGAIVVGIMIVPLVSSLCEDAIVAVPKSLREGAYGLGSTKLEVSLRVVVPAALSGIMASFVLALSRAIGETMAVTLAAGARPNLTLDPRDQIQTMTAYIVSVSRGDSAVGTTEYNTIFAIGLTLFVMTFGMNMIARRLVRRFRIAYL